MFYIDTMSVVWYVEYAEQKELDHREQERRNNQEDSQEKKTDTMWFKQCNR